MNQLKYSDESEIREKINILFSYRKLTTLLHLTGLEHDKSFTAGLIDLQLNIYLLDAYLESVWQLDDTILEERWQSIYQSMERLGFQKTKSKKWLKEIRLYERIEKNSRRNKWPTRVPFRTFYTIKSCDVRLIRQLIYAQAPTLKKEWKQSSWAYYDMITEINDDITDVREDLPTYNGNRFLISILRKGLAPTMTTYERKIDRLMTESEKYFGRCIDDSAYAQMNAWTLESAVDTLNYLRSIPEAFDPIIFEESILLPLMK